MCAMIPVHMISLTNPIALLSAVDEELGGQMKSNTVVLKAKHHVFVHLNYNNMVGACIVAIALTGMETLPPAPATIFVRS